MIVCNILSAYGDKFKIQIEPTASIYDLKMYLETEYSIPSKNLELIYQNQILEDFQKLDSVFFNQYPNIMMDSHEISIRHELTENKGKKDKALILDLLENFHTCEIIGKINEVPCTQFSLNYSISRKVPTTFFIFDNGFFKKTAILDSTSTASEILQMMRLDQSKYELYSTRRLLYNQERLSELGIIEPACLRGTIITKSKSKPLTELEIFSRKKCIFFPANDNMTILELKKCISDSKFFENSIREMVLSYNGMALNNNRKISFYKIPNKSKIDYSVLYSSEKLYISLLGNNFQYSKEFNIKQSFNHLLSHLKDELNIPAESIFMFYDNVLIEDLQKSFNDFTKESQIEIEVRTKNDPFFLIQTMKEKTIYLKIDVSKGDTVYNIKEKISDLSNVLIGNLSLFDHDIELNDSLLIEEYKIEYGSIINAYKHQTSNPICISVLLRGEEVKFNSINHNFYVRDLKKLIHGNTNDTINEIELSFQPQKLDDGMMLAQLHPNEGMNLVLAPKLNTVHFRVLTAINDDFEIDVMPQLSIKDLKLFIDCLLGQLNKQMVIYFEGKSASDEKTLSDIGVKNSSTIFVLFQ